MVRVCITDMGKGADEKGIEQLFKPFFTTKPKGTGLGLAICRRLIEQHRGSIAAANNPAGGMTFTIELPVEQNGALPA
jgi:signal transduction histidine kinase